MTKTETSPSRDVKNKAGGEGRAQGPPPPASFSGCMVDVSPNGQATVMFTVDPDIMRRIKLKAHTQELDQYIWLNIIRPALHSHVY